MTDSPESQLAEPIFDKLGEDSEAQSTKNSSATPASEISPPESPPNASAVISKTEDGRARVRRLVASLSLEEQVRWKGPVCCVHVLIS